MKLIKCKKCGSTIMTNETMLSSMQEEYNSLVKKAHKARGTEKQLIVQQLKHLNKIMVAVCHSTSESEIRKLNAYNELNILKKYIIKNNILGYDILDKIQNDARELSKKKAAEDESAIAELYGEFENMLFNRTKSDPTATQATKRSGTVQNT